MFNFSNKGTSNTNDAALNNAHVFNRNTKEVQLLCMAFTVSVICYSEVNRFKNGNKGFFIRKPNYKGGYLRSI